MDYKAQVKEFFRDNFMYDDSNGVADNESLLDKGVMDSTGVIELVMFLEEYYHIEVSDDEIIPANFDSFDSIEKYLLSKVVTGGKSGEQN